jgi:hypothetical protein
MKYYKNVFRHFARLEGSQHIASEYALRGIEKIIRDNQVKSVFEFGIGIGTIPFLVKKINKDILYVGTETNEFCINAFQNNLNALIDNKFIHLLSEQDTPDIKFDLIIVDGKFSNVSFINKIAHKDSVFFIEGDREEQRKLLLEIFPDALVSRCISIKKNQSWSPFIGHYQGGYTIYRLNSSSFKNIISFIREKLVSAVKYRIRRFL